MPSLTARIAKAMPLDSQQNVSDIARYRCKKPGTLVSIIPFFLVITALIVWSHLCESRYGSLRPVFNKMSKQFGFATGRTAMFFWFDHLFFITGKNNIITKNDHYGFFPQWPNNFAFLAFQVYTVYIYIWSTKSPWVHEFNKWAVDEGIPTSSLLIKRIFHEINHPILLR